MSITIKSGAKVLYQWERGVALTASTPCDILRISREDDRVTDDLYPVISGSTGTALIPDRMLTESGYLHVSRIDHADGSERVLETVRILVRHAAKPQNTASSTKEIDDMQTIRMQMAALERAAREGKFDGKDGTTPHIGENGNWWIGNDDTGIAATGDDGITPHIGGNGNWYIGDTDTGVKATGDNGITPHIGENGNWYIGDEDTGVLARNEDVSLYADDMYTSGILEKGAMQLKILEPSGSNVIRYEIESAVVYIKGIRRARGGFTTSTQAVSFERLFANILRLNEEKGTFSWRVAEVTRDGDNLVNIDNGEIYPARSGGYYDLIPYLVHVPAGATAITYDMVEDLRNDERYCGYVRDRLAPEKVSELENDAGYVTDDQIENVITTEPQELTDAEKAQARANIGAAAVGEGGGSGGGGVAEITSDMVVDALGYIPVTPQQLQRTNENATAAQTTATAANKAAGEAKTAVAELSETIDSLPNDETLINNVVEVVKTEVPLVKSAERPVIVESIDEMTDTSLQYVLATDGYFYRYTQGVNYNLLKLSEVSYSTRLQNDIAGTTSSNVNNLVTGWIPVKYGKYYTPSVLFNGSRIVGNSAFSLIVRVNVKLDDGTIIAYGNTVADRQAILYQPGVNETITLEHENAVAVRLHFLVNNQDISTQAKFEAYQPMLVEGGSIEDATHKSTTYAYINGDAIPPVSWNKTGLAYNQPADYEDRVIKLESDTKKLKDKTSELEDKIQSSTNSSPYYRDVNFGVVPISYYHGVAESYENSVFGWTTKYADFITMWKSLVANHSGYVTETALGTASDGQTIYLYDFNPARLSNRQKDVPKIIIIAGQHGGESCNIYGLYYFVSNLLNKWNQHPALDYLRNHVELMIVPVLNTYGFGRPADGYKNANGVNLNRNYDSNWSFVSDATSLQYGGEAPFDQPETQIVRDLLLNNQDAVLVVDSHVNGGGKVANYSDINYYGISESADGYFNRMVDAVSHNLSAISANFNLDYSLQQPDTIMGFLNHGDGIGILRNWARDKNFVSVLVEGFGGFPNGTAFTAEVYKANEEILVNWLTTAMYYLADDVVANADDASVTAENIEAALGYIPVTPDELEETNEKATAAQAAAEGASQPGHTQEASTITAGTFAGQVVANASAQTPGTALLRNSKIVSADTTPTNNGEICWTYK